MPTSSIAVEKRPGVTLALAERAATLSFDDLPRDIVERAQHCVLDWCGVALAGAHEPLVQILVDDALDQGGAPQATLVGRSERVSTQQAALINGAASHALDYDDVHASFTGHTTVPLVAALLALGEQRGASGRDLLTAFVAGFETSCRIGTLLGTPHYDQGFHATATVGSLGVAAACANLLKLDADSTAHAIGIAATEASGLKSMFGTMCKPMHAGMAAQRGLHAASLASRGFIARPDALECTQGFAETLAGAFNVEEALADPEGGYFLLSNLFKFHAACYLTHAAIESATRLRSENALTPANVSTCTVRVNPASDKVCNIAEPTTALEAKFSLRFMTAWALNGADTASIATYTDEACSDRDMVGLRERVRVEFDSGLDRMESLVRVETQNGDIFEAHHDASIPIADTAVQGARLMTKFLGLTQPILGEGRAAGLANSVETLSKSAGTVGVSVYLAEEAG
jgi:2-methylcitrate dehydratase PrpD